MMKMSMLTYCRCQEEYEFSKVVDTEEETDE